jgi:hypothetical protein
VVCRIPRSKIHPDSVSGSDNNDPVCRRQAVEYIFDRIAGACNGSLSPVTRSITNQNLNPNLHLLIFSKDRACQLDSLLRSLRDNLGIPNASTTILFRAGSDDFEAGYERVKSRRIIERVQWIPETDFRSDLLAICAGYRHDDLLMPLVDDDIFFRPLCDTALLAAFARQHLFISLRADRAYSSDIVPRFVRTQPHLEWRWNYHRKKPVTWNYPFSLDGNIFRAGVFTKIVRSIEFPAPNSLEGRMHAGRHRWWIKRIGKALAPGRAVLFNNPLNRVQTEGATWHAAVDPVFLNTQYLAGRQIDNAPLYNVQPTAIHHSVDVSLISVAG